MNCKNRKPVKRQVEISQQKKVGRGDRTAGNESALSCTRKWAPRAAKQNGINCQQLIDLVSKIDDLDPAGLLKGDET